MAQIKEWIDRPEFEVMLRQELTRRGILAATDDHVTSLSAILARGAVTVQRMGIDRYGRTVVPMLLNGCGAVQRARSLRESAVTSECAMSSAGSGLASRPSERNFR